jgi:uncharacterized protein
MNLTFLGGADEVGASSTLIEIGGKLLLVDVGIRISPRTSRGIQNDQLPDLRPISDAGGPDYILVTHAHTDHTGALPLVVEQYPHVPVLATQPTIDLVRVLQADAQRIMQGKQEAEGEIPLFDDLAVDRLMQAFQVVNFAQPVRLGEGLQVTYHPSGHIVGAGSLVIESEEGTLVMSGDVSLSEQRAVVKASIPRIKADALVIESTYGGKLHANRIAEERRLIETLTRVTEQGGKVLIPAFALGRAQEILQIILAYRDHFDAPVYADGMVRAVCRAYNRFTDVLPAGTVQAAGEEDLFFRDKIKPVENALQREEIARSEGAAVIVASSGMLTGGASVVYARHLAGDARNAILLTGYQDEEAPGRFLQRMMRERQAGEEITLNVDRQVVTVRCDIDTYSLSAHADEAELVSVCEALGAPEIMLVHGDPSARHSLATRLRQREKGVRLPQIGQTIAFDFVRRPWAMGGIAAGSEVRPLDPGELWDALKPNAGSYYSARELARMWWGDEARSETVISILTTDPLYFAPDWRRRDTFQVRTPEQVARVQKQRAVMLAYPNLVGQLVVLRDSNNRPRIGVVVDASAEEFEAVVHNAKGRHYPGDALLWVIGTWQGPSEDRGMKQALTAVYQQAKSLQDVLLPFERRQMLVNAGHAVHPASLLPEILPEGVTPEIAFVALVLALVQDGATLEADGLLPKRALQDGPMEMNIARQTTLATFPAEARLRKVGMEPLRKRIILNFDFPDRAASEYADVLDQVADQTGWEVMINPTVNQQALGLAFTEILPDEVHIVKGPSFYMEQREVQIEVEGASDLQAIERDYLRLTGFRLRATRRGDKQATEAVAIPTDDGHDKLEINVAYGLIRRTLEPLGLYKTSLKQGQIVLTFVSPQVGARHQEIINALSQETGYVLSIYPHPNQQQILQIAQRLARDAGWQIRKGPGIHIDRAEIAMSLAGEPDAGTVEHVSQVLDEQTGYRLVLS